MARTGSGPVVRVRPARVGDADGIRAIYNHEVTSGTATFDTVLRSHAARLRWIDAHSGPHPAVVAETPAGVVGFGALFPYGGKPAYAPTVEDSVYVGAGSRGAGVGRAILEELLRLAVVSGRHSVIARVAAEGGLASLRLHGALGFTQVGVEREVGEKFGRRLDVVVLQRML